MRFGAEGDPSEGFFGYPPLKLNIVPENGWLEDYFPFGKAYFQRKC